MGIGLGGGRCSANLGSCTFGGGRHDGGGTEVAMYLRHTTVTKNGKTHTYWRLVRSVRSGRKVRQETVAQLGELDARGRVKARALARSLVGVGRQPGLFDEGGPERPLGGGLERA